MQAEIKKFKRIRTLGASDSAVIGKVYEAYWCEFNGGYVAKVDGYGLCLMEEEWFEEVQEDK